MERRISRLRVRPTERIHKDGAPSRGPGQLLLDLWSNSPSRALRDGSVLPAGQSKAGGTGAHCAPLRGGSHFPSYCNSKWAAAAKRDNAFTRAARPEGKWGDSQEVRNRRCLPSCAPAARSGYVPAARRRRNPLPVGNGHKRCAFQCKYEHGGARSFASLRMTKKGRFPTPKGGSRPDGTSPSRR